MEKEENGKPYDLEERALLFAKRVRAFLKVLPRTDAHVADGRQMLRCSASIGANYIEANEALGKKDFFCRFASVGKKRRRVAFFSGSLNPAKISRPSAGH